MFASIYNYGELRIRYNVNFRVLLILGTLRNKRRDRRAIQISGNVASSVVSREGNVKYS